MNPKVTLSSVPLALPRFHCCKCCEGQAHRDSSLSPLSLAAFVGRNVILTSGCIIGACCNVNTYEVIPENTVIYGADCLRRVQTERPQVCLCVCVCVTGDSCCPRAGPSPPLPPSPAPDAAAGFPDEDPAQLPPPEEDHEAVVHPGQELSTHPMLPVRGRVFGPGKHCTLWSPHPSFHRTIFFFACLCDLFIFHQECLTCFESLVSYALTLLFVLCFWE